MQMQMAEELKRKSAVLAARSIEEGMVVGLGTGSTVAFLLEEIARRRAAGELQRIRCVPTSQRTAARATELQIPLTDLAHAREVDLTIDGADEVDPHLDLIKGLGGALLREKIVAAASRRLIIIVDTSKRVNRLGTRSPLPVEVDPFGAAVQMEFLRSLGAEPVLRMASANEPLVTDGGNWIIDCRFPDGIADPAALELQLNNQPGIVENGLFIQRATEVIVAGEQGTEVLTRERVGAA